MPSELDDALDAEVPVVTILLNENIEGFAAFLSRLFFFISMDRRNRSSDGCERRVVSR